jgi:hypothetical protein
MIRQSGGTAIVWRRNSCTPGRRLRLAQRFAALWHRWVCQTGWSVMRYLRPPSL